MIYFIPYDVQNFMWSLSFRMAFRISYGLYHFVWYDALRHGMMHCDFLSFGHCCFGGEILKLAGSAVLKIPNETT